jgi:hypothetical protein
MATPNGFLEETEAAVTLSIQRTRSTNLLEPVYEQSCLICSQANTQQQFHNSI